jgi:uncharacterized protein
VARGEGPSSYPARPFTLPKVVDVTDPSAHTVGLREQLPVIGTAGPAGAARNAPKLEPGWSPEAFHILAKPTGAACNLGCSYCFFLDKEALYPDDPLRMSDEALEVYIAGLVEGHGGRGEIAVAWQGGEPTLMGLDFFRRAAAVQERHRGPGLTFSNAIQTNGTLLDDEWCAFLAEQQYLVGLSLDGPAAVHDSFRVDKGGHPTFDRVMRGLRLLQKHEVDVNILTTVNAVNGRYPLPVYRFLRDDAGADWIQFIPVVERVGVEAAAMGEASASVTERSVGSEQFGRFLIEVFDEWVRNDVGDVFVQTFEATLRNFMGLPSTMCVFDETCGTALALEHNGDLYSCDHFVEPEYRLGNIAEVPMVELVASRQQYEFGQAKRGNLPQYCLDCNVRFACNGECPKNRFITTPDGEPGLNYLCAGLKAFFHHVDGPMRVMGEALRSGRDAGVVMAMLQRQDTEVAEAVRRAGRNERCPCGSGRKTKACHGRGSVVEPIPATLPRHAPRPPVVEGRGSATTRGKCVQASPR